MSLLRKPVSNSIIRVPEVLTRGVIRIRQAIERIAVRPE